MNKTILNLKQINELILKNRYKVDNKTKFISRCIDGRYPNESGLPALAFPGADLGELILILSASNCYGFEVDFEKAKKSLIEVIGKEENFRIHTDSHADPKVPAGGCGHWKQIQLDPSSYNLKKEDIEFIKSILNKINSKIKNPVVLHGDHLEGAVLFIKGSWGVYPQYYLETEKGKQLVEVFIYHQTLVDERHKALVSALLRNKAVIFRNGEDENWLYNALSDMAENHLMETAKRLAKGLPIYEVVFDDDGNFQVKEEGVV